MEAECFARTWVTLQLRERSVARGRAARALLEPTKVFNTQNYIVKLHATQHSIFVRSRKMCAPLGKSTREQTL
jgi:hypothetical protein